MKLTTVKIVNLILAMFLLMFTVTYTFAWFANEHSDSLTFDIETSGYFSQGNGSVSNPFVINSQVHLYNLAWLQDMGRLQNGGDGYYFILGSNIDMGTTVIPPIGTADNPFIGNFNGQGKTISNLTVSTNWDVLTFKPSTQIEFSSYVGLFGRTGIPTTKQAVVKNFILNDPLVEISEVGNYDTTEGAPESGASITAAGLAVGYAYGEIENIAVYKGRLKAGLDNYTTANSIIGALHSSVDGSDIGITQGEGNEGNNVGYMITSQLFQLIGSINETIALNDKGHTLITSDYGYTADYRPELRWTKSLNPNITESAHGLGIFGLTANGEKIRLRNQGMTSFNYYEIGKGQIASTDTFKGLISYDTVVDGKNWGGIVTNPDGTIYDVDNIEYSFRFTSVPIPINGSDLNISNESTYPDYSTVSNYTTALSSNVLYFNMTDMSNAYFLLIGHSSGSSPTTLQINRAMSDTILSQKMKAKARRELEALGSYDSATIDSIVENVDNTDFFFQNDYDILTSDIVIDDTTLCYSELPPARNRALTTGYKFDLSQFEAGLYTLSVRSGSNSDIQYIKASGVAGEGGSSGPSGVDNVITNVDFVNTLNIEYDTTTDNFVNFSKLETRIYFGTSSIVILWFERNSDNTTITVYYNGAEPLASNAELANISSTTDTIVIG